MPYQSGRSMFQMEMRLNGPGLEEKRIWFLVRNTLQASLFLRRRQRALTVEAES